MENGFDAVMGGLGFFPVTAPISAYWSLGGKALNEQWKEKVLMPQIKMGVPAHSIFGSK